jgi:hypothetical protein
MALPGCSKPKVEEGYIQEAATCITTTNVQSTRKKHSDTYNVDFFTHNFFLLSGLGAGIALKALASAVLLAKGRVCFGGATTMVTIELRLAAAVIAPARP